MADTKIDCIKCINFYVTWDKARPYGCKALKFKSKKMPSLVVLESSGKDCMLFERKEPAR